MRVLFFGRLREAASTASFEFPGSPQVLDVRDLRDWFAERDPELGAALSAPGIRVAVDQQFADSAASIEHATEVAFMPPLSGG